MIVDLFQAPKTVGEAWALYSLVAASLGFEVPPEPEQVASPDLVAPLASHAFPGSPTLGSPTLGSGAPRADGPPLMVFDPNAHDAANLAQRLDNAVVPSGTETAPALVVLTSGSTGEPSMVMLSKDALSAGADATHQFLGGAGKWVAALPLTHVAGLMVLARAAVAGEPPSLELAVEPFSPQRFHEVTHEAIQPGAKGRLYTALVSRQLDLLLASDVGRDALRAYSAVLVGGGKLSDSLLERAKTAGVNVVTTYGMTETSGGCVYNGTPLPGTEVRIKPDGNVHEEDPHEENPHEGDPHDGKADSPSAGPDIGRVHLFTPALMTGYVDEDAPIETYGGKRWLVTSDVGRLGPDGRLEILGRLDDVINTGGKKVSAGQVRGLLLQDPHLSAAVQDAFVFGLEDEQWGEVVVAALVPKPQMAAAATPTAADSTTLAALAEAARDAVGRVMGRYAAPRVVFTVDRLPRTSLGKVNRRALTEAVKSALDTGAAWQR